MDAHETQVRGRGVVDQLLEWYRHDVGLSLLAYAELGSGRRLHIVDCTKVEVPLGPSPFERTAEIQCPLIGLFGEADSNPSPADMRMLDAELTRHGKVHEFHSYPGANHVFMNARRERYHTEATQDSWPKTLAFFEKYLGKVSAASS